VLALLAVGGLGAGPWLWPRLAGLGAGTRQTPPAGVFLALGALGCGAMWSWRRGPEPSAVCVLLAASLALVTLVPYESDLGSPRPIARVIAEQWRPGDAVVLFRHFNSGVPFYLGSTVDLLEVPRELMLDRKSV